jgi:hypothetical protein
MSTTLTFPVHPFDEECREFDLLAPSVLGWATDDGTFIRIEQLKAVREGCGDVGRFLDSLPTNVVIWNVVSDRLEGMLRRRGWQPETPQGRFIELWRKA